eukprot:TRINITY_DN61787_c0_g1_i1.p1 TRINITY_DN61787_c0_g1~~TRINITY_DN61787_c0_g1_i1.p1  ORF type:complete len:1186 (-),score=190.20 TRINITY_DN61787_c0_g1_i1:121-3522(-)
MADFSCTGAVQENVFYFKGRQRRRIYDDLQLHAFILTLIIALLVTPKKGLLDSRYCEQYPLHSNKRNILFLLSLHLNHSANRAVLPWLSHLTERIGEIGGFRLLKLLCETTMHRWMYTNRNRIAGGTFGTVYHCTVQLGETSSVAVKQIPKQTSIQDRCVFFDVFSEVACLDAVRFKKHVCELYDYGVDVTGYWIVMKYYTTTLKKWRQSIPGAMRENLPVLLEVYSQVLKAVSVFHARGIVHYDLKCDNIMIDIEHCADPGAPPRVAILEGVVSDEAAEKAVSGALGASVTAAGRDPLPRVSVASWASPVKEDEPMPPVTVKPLPISTEQGVGVSSGNVSTRPVPCIAVCDFGESRVFAAADELDARNRGTEIIKCPEMLEIENFGRKDGNYFDRRKRVGTDSSADIWSLGCLLFELLTGRFLFQDDDVARFWARVTGKMAGALDDDIVSMKNCRLLENNAPLIEFIRYLLVRDPKRRPTIKAVQVKFNAASIEALRLSASGESGVDEADKHSSGGSCDTSTAFCALDSPHSVARSIGASSGGATNSNSGGHRPDRPLVCAAAGAAESYLTKVFQDISVLEASDEDLSLVSRGADMLERGRELLERGGAAMTANPALSKGFRLKAWLSHCPWTHIVDCRAPGAVELPYQLDVPNLMVLPWSSPSRSADEFLSFLPMAFDFLRQAAMTRGIVLFIDGSDHLGQTSAIGGVSVAQSASGNRPAGVSGASSSGNSATFVVGRGGLAMAFVLALVAETTRMATYSALSFLSSQLLIAAIRPDVVAALGRWQETKRRGAWRRVAGKARVGCLCGACSWHVPTSWLTEAESSYASAGSSVRDTADRPTASDSSRPHRSNRSQNSGRGIEPSVVVCRCGVSGVSIDAQPGCPCRGNCDAYVRWLYTRFGETTRAVHWLWLPAGEAADKYADGPEGTAVLTRGSGSCAELVGEVTCVPGTHVSSVGGSSCGSRSAGVVEHAQRFRCRLCQVMTHVEVSVGMLDPSVQPPPRTALVLTYEFLRLARAFSQTAAIDTTSNENDLHEHLERHHDLNHFQPKDASGDQVRFNDASLEEVVLPRAELALRSIFDAIETSADAALGSEVATSEATAAGYGSLGFPIDGDVSLDSPRLRRSRNVTRS